MNALATVDLVRAVRKNSAWHILALPDRTRTLCSWEIGDLIPLVEESDVDSHVVQMRGRPVCGKCRRALR